AMSRRPLPDAITLETPPVDVALSINPRARRFTLRLNPPGHGATLTLPPRVPEVEIRQFLARQSGWLAEALSRQPGPVEMGDGASLPVAGEMVRVVIQPGPRRTPVLGEGCLSLSGLSAPGPRIAAWLKERARARMAPMVQFYAERLGREVAGIALKDTRSRWGSCSSAGRINLSWRLAMAPTEVQDYLCAHEAAHLVEMNHSSRYWAVLSNLMPGFERPRRWLRSEGPKLHAYRFESA
ncbi:MAG: SprT family zinc-dependent metalloprotease, partial [Pseudomonadota bacterium]